LNETFPTLCTSFFRKIAAYFNHIEDSMKRRSLLVALSILLAIPLLGFGRPGPALVPVASPTILTLISGGGSGGFGTPDPIVKYAIVGGSSGQARIVSPNAAYGIIPGTRWVNTSGLASPDQAFLKTTNYSVSFALPDCYASPSIKVQILADNAATLFINGAQFGQQPQSAIFPNFQVISTFTGSSASAFHSGANTLTISNADYSFVNGVDFRADVTFSGFKFGGFFPPVDNPGSGPKFVFNKVKAGSTVPVKFSLCANQGANVIAAGYPRSEKVSCDASALIGDDKATVTPGNSKLVYTAATGRYHYNWQTDKAWGGTCRKLTVRLTDGTDHVAYFNFFK
jgi:hypothetical protein